MFFKQSIRVQKKILKVMINIIFFNIKNKISDFWKIVQ